MRDKDEIDMIIKDLGSYDMVDRGSPFQPWQDLKKVKDGEVGEWVDAEDAAREILRLRRIIEEAGLGRTQ